MALQWFLTLFMEASFLDAQPGPGTPADTEKVTLHEFPMINPRTEPRDRLGTKF